MKKIFVHRYKWSHDKRRKQTRRDCKDGKITMLEQNQDGFLYAVPQDYRVKK